MEQVKKDLGIDKLILAEAVDRRKLDLSMSDIERHVDRKALEILIEIERIRGRKSNAQQA
jgi:hypothetical protein